MLNREEIVRDSLRLQLEILTMMAKRHSMWADRTHDLETARIHMEVANLAQKLTQHLSQLFDRYDSLGK